MEFNRVIHSQELVTEGYDSFYDELEREISILTADSEDDDFYSFAKPSSSPWMAKRSSSMGYIGAKHQEISYFCWREDENGGNSVPTWLLNLWRNNNNKGSGTGVFIPHVANSRRINKPRKKNSDRGRMYKTVPNKIGSIS